MVGGNMLESYLKENNLIICPNDLAKSLVNEINNMSNLTSYKIMDLHQFLENYYFSYNGKTIYYLIKKLDIPYEVALEYLESMFFIEDTEYHSKRLNELVNLKKELLQKKLLILHPGFKEFLKQVNIIIYGYSFLDPFYQKIVSDFPDCIQVEVSTNDQQHSIYEFKDIEDEIAYICHDIKKKLDKGIPIENIKLLTPGSEYTIPLKRIFAWCHIPIEMNNKISLYDIKIGKNVIDMINDNLSFSDIIASLQQQEIELDILKSFITIFNQYVEFKEESKALLCMIEYDLKHTYITKKTIKNSIKICNWNQITEKDYVYILGFNKENYPVIYKDIEFLSDSMKQEIGLWDSNSKNIYSMEDLKNHLNQPYHLMITYKKRTAFNSYNPSILIQEMGYTTILNPPISYQISHFYNQITLAKKYDQFYKYGIFDEVMKTLKYHYANLDYRTYQNQFTKIEAKEFLESLKKPFTLSYSTIDEYYRCSFRYYISNILKIKEEGKDDFYINIGNIFHAILAKCFNRDFDFNEEWNFEVKKYSFPFNKLIFLERLKQELEYDIQILYKHLNYSYFNEFLYEKRFMVSVFNSKNIPVHFIGIVDKISYLREQNKTLVSIIDYKTGHLSTELNNVIYGIGMQLPIYLYFVKRSEMFPNAEIVGFYLQKIINKDIKKTTGKNIEEEKENMLKLVGYSTDQEEELGKFDMTYQDSNFINGLKRKKEGFYAYSKILNRKQMKKLDNLVSQKIENAVEQILEGEFSINPKRIDKNIVGCEYCNYRDLCYRTEKDYIDLEKHRNLDFLGGDSNA